MPLGTPLATSWGVAQLMQPADDPSIPDESCRIILQGAEGQLSLIVSDHDAVAALIEDWTPYKAGVDAAIADLTGQTPWPDAPMYTISVAS